MTKGKRKEARGKKEANSLSFSLLLLASCLLLSACKHKKHAAHDDVDKKDDDKPPVTAVGTGAGHTLVYPNSDPKSPPSFSLAWTQSDFDIAKGSLDKGHMVLPKGQIYQDAKPATDYRSETGDADGPTNRLDMRDKVVFKSIEGKGTLHSDRGQYRGDVKIIRAMGNVVATGPFGTLSGMPEAWATPDLKIIGSPKMVAKFLKMPSLVALAANAAVGSPVLQKVDGDVFARGKAGGQFADNRDPAHPKLTVEPPKDGPLVITLPSRGLVFRFSHTANLEFVPKTRKVRHMTSEGPVNVVQTTAVGENTLDGVGSVYDAPANAETATLDLGGRVTLVSRGKGKTGGGTVTTAKGDKGRAILLQQTPPGGDGLRSATLTGNVVVDSLGDDGGTFNGTGDQGVYTPHGETADVDMTGHVVMTSVTKGKDKDAQGNPVTNKTVGHGQTGHGVVLSKTAAGASPLKHAVLDRDVTLDVSGSNGQTFRGANGERLVYDAQGEGGKAVMTGPALKFTGEGAEFLGDTTGADTATIMIGKDGWKTVALDNSEGKPTTTTYLPKETPKTKPAATPKKGKGGKP